MFALSGLALSSCGWRLANVRGTPAIDSSASNELYLYTWSNYASEALIQEFQAETKIRVIGDVFDSNETMLAKMLAGGGGAYSVISPSDYMVKRMVELKIIRELDHSQLVGLDTLLPRFQNPVYDPQNRHSIPITWGTTGLVYNAAKLKQPIEDWEDLWRYQDVLQKRITLFDDVREVMGAVLRMLGYSYNSTDAAELKQAYEKLQELKPAIAAFTTDAWRDQILAGDVLVAMSYSPDAISVTQESPDLKFVIPRSGTSVWTDTMVIPTSARNVDGAYAWLNYILQPTVATQFSTNLNFATANQAAYEELPAELKNNTTLFPPETLLANSQGIRLVGDFAEVYDTYWTKLRSG
jgi:spermidine/putrescine transport system substrate-binding protein